MYIYDDFIKKELPAKYIRNSRKCFLDEYRKKLILITPEEIVRQRILRYLIEDMNVPKDMIKVEQKLSHYNIRSNNRVDIVIHTRGEDQLLYPIAIVECKAENVSLDTKVIDQAFNYADLIECNYIFITNGQDIYSYKYLDDKERYISLNKIPNYNKMINEEFIEYDFGDIPKRIKFEDLKKRSLDRDEFLGYIGSDTNINYKPFLLNLLECFLDISHVLPNIKSNNLKVIKDYGIRIMSYGNAGGGVFNGPYRTILIEDKNGNNQFISFLLSSYNTDRNEIEKTVLNVAIDDFNKSHNALQLVIDNHVSLYKNKVKIWHNGRIGISNIGSGKVEELKKVIQEDYPDLLDDSGKIILGEINHDRLLFMDDEEIALFIKRLMEYALIRDKFRKIIKESLNKN